MKFHKVHVYNGTLIYLLLLTSYPMILRIKSKQLQIKQDECERTSKHPYKNSFHNVACSSKINFTNTKNIAATDLDATAILLEPMRVPVGDVIPELLKSPVELHRLCKVPELDVTEQDRCCGGCGLRGVGVVRLPRRRGGGGGGGEVCVGEGEVGTGDMLVELGLSECKEPVD
jgi:hypothetical protein